MRVECGLRLSQGTLNRIYERVRAAEYAPRGPHRVLERRHCLAVIVERGVGVEVERPRVTPSQSQRVFSIRIGGGGVGNFKELGV